MEHQKYIEGIKSRTLFRYYAGLLARLKTHLKQSIAVCIARHNGAEIGEGVVLPIALAKKANHNLRIGNHVSIQTDKIDLRSLVEIGSNVIIGGGGGDNHCFS